ncbi:MAG: 6-phosphogluconolactonase [Halioglobus sp.]
MSNWQLMPDTNQLDQKLAQHIAGKLAEDLQKRGTASLAVSGGGTPKGLFQRLSKCDLDWENIQVTLVDERWVGLESPDSNEQMLRDKLLQNNASNARIVGLKTADKHGKDGLAEARRRIAGIGKPFSAVILGVGGDGHTASWFPQAANLAQLVDPAGSAEVEITDPVTAPHQRITLTLPAVLNTREVIVHIVGAEKRTVVESAIEKQFPIALILEQTKTPVTIWWAP